MGRRPERCDEYQLQEYMDTSGTSVAANGSQEWISRPQKNQMNHDNSSFTAVRWWNTVIIPKSNRHYKIWVHVILIWAIYSSFFTPIEFGFLRGLPKHLWWIDQIGQIIFMVDIAVNFFVAYRDPNTYKWTVDHQSIAIRYAKSSLIPEILACLPWDAIYRKSGDMEVMRYFLWLRLYRVRKVDAFFRRTEQNIRVNYLFTRIMKLITVELYCTHTAACIFYYLATTLPASKEEFTWIGSLTLGGYSFENFREIDLGRRYVVSLYFAIVTMATVGYGDIHAVNTREMIFVMIFVSFDMILGAYLIGNMTALIVKGSNTEKFRDRMASLKKYMNRNHLNRNLRTQLKNHVRLQYESQFTDDQVVQELPLSIRAKVSESLYVSIIERTLLFRNCSNEFINQLGMRMHEEYFLPGEVVMEQGNAVDQIYIVAGGALVEVFINPNGSDEIIANLEAESTFGEVAVLCSIPQPSTVRVVDLCKVLRIGQQAFFGIMRVYFADGRQVLNNLLKFGKDAAVKHMGSEIGYNITELEVELSLKVNNAAYQGNTLYLKSLIKSGADPNRADYDGRTPLHLAAMKGHEDIVRFLVQEGAQVDSEDIFGNTPLIEAVKGHHTQVIKILRSAGASLAYRSAGDHLHRAILAGNSELVRSLLDNGVDPNSRDHNGQTALHIAASKGMVVTVRILLEHGASLHARERWGRTPMQESLQFGSNALEAIMKEAEMYSTAGGLTRLSEKGDNSLHMLDSDPQYDAALLSERSTEEESCPQQRCGSFLMFDKEAKRRCTLFPFAPWTAPKDQRRGLVVWIPNTISELLEVASQQFGEEYKSAVNQDGGEFRKTEFIRDSERVYLINE